MSVRSPARSSAAQRRCVAAWRGGWCHRDWLQLGAAHPCLGEIDAPAALPAAMSTFVHAHSVPQQPHGVTYLLMRSSVRHEPSRLPWPHISSGCL